MLASLVTASPEDLRTGAKILAGLADEGEIAGIHLEGPWLSERRAGAHPKGLLRDPDPAEIDDILAAGRGHVRMITLAPERAGALDAIRQIVDSGAVAAIGHTDATYATTRAALAAGASVATHLYNAMRPPHHREPGPVVALIEDAGVSLELVLDDVHLHPAVFRQVLAAAGADRIALVTDAMAAAGMTDGAYPLGSADVTVKDGTARVRGTNTIAGSTATGDELFRRAMAECGRTGDDALRTAVRLTSANPARALGLTDRTGAVGGRADLVVLDADLCATRVMVAGAWLS
jgi:N-acetylglucosamine-6-phosphate deacetylase